MPLTKEQVVRSVERETETRLSQLRISAACISAIVAGGILFFVWSWEPIESGSRPPAAMPDLINRYIPRLVKFFNSDEQSDVAMLGSSLLYEPVCFADFRYHPTLDKPRDFIEGHYRSQRLEELASSYMGDSKKIVSLAVPSSTITDDKLLFDKLVEAGKRPALLVCCIAPRDFLVHPWDGAQSAVESLLADYIAIPSTLKFTSQIVNAWISGTRNFVDWERRGRTRIFENLTTRATILKRAVSVDLKNGIRVHWHQWQTDATAVAKRAPMTDAKTQNDDSRPADLSDLNYLKPVFCYAAIPYMTGQFKSLETLLQLAGKRRIKVLIVLMPLTEPHKDLLKGSLASAYNRELERLLFKYQPNVFVPDADGSWDLSLFSDSAHLNSVGAERFISGLGQAISISLSMPNSRLRIRGTRAGVESDDLESTGPRGR
jgi:hypothetical protein